MKGFLLLVIGFILGFSTGMSATSDAKPEMDYGAGCRGNGDGGYRACRVNVPGDMRKIAINVYEDGEFDFGIVWRPLEELDYKEAK